MHEQPQEQSERRRHHYGSGEAHCEVARFDIAQYFGSIGNADPAGILTFPLVATQRDKEWTAGDERQRLWRVLSTVREVQRRADAAPLTPLQTGIIERDGVNRTLLKLRISVTQMGFDPRDFVIDAGWPLELWGQNVTVHWVAPATVDVVPGSITASPINVNVIDGLLGVQILGIETPLGFVAPLTDYRPSAQNTQLVIPIPRGAIDVTVYQTAAGAASVNWLWQYGATAIAWPLGQLPFIAAQRRTHTTSIVPGATHLVSDVDPAADRFFTIVWTIRP